MRQLVYGEDERVAAWAAARIAGCAFRSDRRAIGVERDGALVGALVFDTFSAADARIHAASARPGWLGRDLLVAAAAFAFAQCELRRLSLFVRFDNDPAKRLAEALGARFEGKMDEADREGRTYLLYGLLRRELRGKPWLASTGPDAAHSGPWRNGNSSPGSASSV